VTLLLAQWRRSKSLAKEWVYLDAFDMLSPRYDAPQRIKHFRIGSKRLELQMLQSDMALTVLKGVVRDATRDKIQRLC
jgi:hypothetical protein